ncbi:hypothetical protein TNCV_3643261 [Trichonephila clavipes]|nr:hypothetical protein TNCV_3643261 [Trichonephila clavipes]
MDVRKCVVPLWHGGTLNSRRATSPLVRLAVGGPIIGRPMITPRHSPSKLRWNRAKSYCHLHGAQSYRHSTCPLTTRNFEGLDQMLLSIRLSSSKNGHFYRWTWDPRQSIPGISVHPGPMAKVSEQRSTFGTTSIIAVNS